MLFLAALVPTIPSPTRHLPRRGVESNRAEDAEHYEGWNSTAQISCEILSRRQQKNPNVYWGL